MSKEVKLQVGVQDQLRPLTLQIPDDAPRPWDGQDRLQYIGGRVPRLEGKAKVTGEAKFTFDVQLPGMLYAKFLRLPVPAALITRIDTAAAERSPGVKAMALVKDQLPMRLHYAGQEILAIAAETLRQAEEALARVKVEYERLPFVTDLEEAKKTDAPLVFAKGSQQQDEVTAAHAGTAEATARKQSGNLRAPSIYTRGGTAEEIEAALTQSEVKVEATYRTQVQTHSALEPHGVVAQWSDNERLTVWASTQGVFSVRDELATVFQLPKSQVQVLTEHVGGGFGAKFGAGLYGVIAARLARQANAPVHLIFDREEEHISGGNRPNSVQQIQIGATRAGKLTAMRAISHGTSGVGTGAGTSGPFKTLYTCDKLYTSDTDVFTNAGPGTAFRAPGHPPGVFALEQAIDELAYQLQMDPLELRRRNTLHHEARQAEFRIGAERFGWARRHPQAGASKGVIKSGVGLANSVWYYIRGVGYQAAIQIHRDGAIELTNGVQDIGSGIRTVMAMVAAEELGCDVSAIAVRIGNTDWGFGPASGGSMTTSGITPAVRDAAFSAKQKMFAIAAPLLGVKPEELRLERGAIFVANSPEKRLSWQQVAAKIPGDKLTVLGERIPDYCESQPQVAGIPYAILGGVHFVEVEVDTQTGVVAVKRVVAVHDCGRPMNRLTLESQIHGGIIQGISYALFEDRILDANTGIMVNPNLEEYKIAGSLDTPQIEAIVIDVNSGVSSTSAKGIGEPATVPVAAAIANAIYHATGARVRELPMTPDKVLAALETAKRGAK